MLSIIAVKFDLEFGLKLFARGRGPALYIEQHLRICFVRFCKNRTCLPENLFLCMCLLCCYIFHVHSYLIQCISYVSSIGHLSVCVCCLVSMYIENYFENFSHSPRHPWMGSEFLCCKSLLCFYRKPEQNSCIMHFLTKRN